jgi:hypothetical protein
VSQKWVVRRVIGGIGGIGGIEGIGGIGVIGGIGGIKGIGYRGLLKFYLEVPPTAFLHALTAVKERMLLEKPIPPGSSILGSGNIRDNILDRGIQEVKNIGGRLAWNLF